jgi:hypothetical protein
MYVRNLEGTDKFACAPKFVVKLRAQPPTDGADLKEDKPILSQVISVCRYVLLRRLIIARDIILPGKKRL